ncbi:MAG: helix-turn-helix transcriptional regulator [Tannerellaceae bacterium]|nr:helix-turn-helix transcriptional regulator [Tannerellaceae bacterium]
MENNFETTICPSCGIIARFGDKWSLRILVLLDREEVLRFNELQKQTPGISQKVLASTLQTLETNKLIHRKVYPEVPPRVEYRLTGLGKSLMEPLQVLVEWALEHADEINEKAG